MRDICIYKVRLQLFRLIDHEALSRNYEIVRRIENVAISLIYKI